jgi:hypothetical protein
MVGTSDTVFGVERGPRRGRLASVLPGCGRPRGMSANSCARQSRGVRRNIDQDMRADVVLQQLVRSGVRARYAAGGRGSDRQIDAVM